LIQLVSSNPNIPLPDPHWYGLLEEIAPDLPDTTVDIVHATMECERIGLTLLDYILYNYHKPVSAQYPGVRHSIQNGLVVLLSARDMPRWKQPPDLTVPVDVLCYEEGHPRDWVSHYPNRLWVTRFWFGGPVWLTYLGVDHVVFDVIFLLNRAWLGALSRSVAWISPSPLHQAFDEVADQIPTFVCDLANHFYKEDSRVHG